MRKSIAGNRAVHSGARSRFRITPESFLHDSTARQPSCMRTIAQAVRCPDEPIVNCPIRFKLTVWRRLDLRIISWFRMDTDGKIRKIMSASDEIRQDVTRRVWIH